MLPPDPAPHSQGVQDQSHELPHGPDSQTPQGIGGADKTLHLPKHLSAQTTSEQKTREVMEKDSCKAKRKKLSPKWTDSILWNTVFPPTAFPDLPPNPQW